MKIDILIKSEQTFSNLTCGDVFSLIGLSKSIEYSKGPYMKCSGEATAVNLLIGYSFDFKEEFGECLIQKLEVKLVSNKDK